MAAFFETIFKPDFVFAILRISSPILFAALASVIAEKAGVVNIGLEGMMMISALFGTLISYLSLIHISSMNSMPVVSITVIRFCSV